MSTKVPTGAELTKVLLEAVELGVLPRHLEGKTFVMTGTLAIKRDDMKRVIQAAGGRTEDRISAWGWNTVLVHGDTGRHGFTNKMAEAQRRGCQVISEPDLCEWILKGRDA